MTKQINHGIVLLHYEYDLQEQSQGKWAHFLTKSISLEFISKHLISTRKSAYIGSNIYKNAHPSTGPPPLMIQHGKFSPT